MDTAEPGTPKFRSEIWGYERGQVDRYLDELRHRTAGAPVVPGLEATAERADRTMADAEAEAADVLLAARRRASEIETAARARAAEIEAATHQGLADTERDREQARRDALADTERARERLEAEVGALRTIRRRLRAELARIARHLDELASDDDVPEEPAAAPGPDVEAGQRDGSSSASSTPRSSSS